MITGEQLRRPNVIPGNIIQFCNLLRAFIYKESLMTQNALTEFRLRLGRGRNKKVPQGQLSFLTGVNSPKEQKNKPKRPSRLANNDKVTRLHSSHGPPTGNPHFISLDGTGSGEVINLSVEEDQPAQVNLYVEKPGEPEKTDTALVNINDLPRNLRRIARKLLQK